MANVIADRKRQGRKFEYVFHWYFYAMDKVKAFKDFKALCIYNGKSPEVVLQELVDRHVRDHYPKNIDIVSESEMISVCHSKGYKTTKRLLMLYRQKDVLKDSSGKWWYTDGFNIYYNKDKVLSFIDERNNNPMARLLKDKESSNGIRESGTAAISG